MRNKLKINSALNLIKTLSSIVFPLITFPYISRILKPENVGKINFATSYINYFSLIAMLGISTYAIRECSKVRENKKELEKISSQLFSINIITTSFSMILLLLSLLLFKRLESYKFLIFIYSANIIFNSLGTDWINTALEDFKYITLRTILFQVISLVLMFLFIHDENDYYKYAIISIISSCGANILNINYRRKYCKIAFTFETEIKKHIKPIFYLFVMNLSLIIFGSADITMLGIYKGNYDVGIYSTANKIQNLINQMVSSLLYVLIPRLSYMFKDENYEKINELLRKVLNIFITLGLPCFIGVVSLSKEIIILIAGNEYLLAAIPLKILMFSFLFSLVGGSFLGNIVLLPSGHEKKYMLITCIATFINVILNLYFIPKFGVNGAAFTTAVASLIIMVLLIINTDRRIKISNKFSIFISPIVGCLAIGISCLIIKQIFNNLYIKMIFSIILSVSCYTIVLFAMKNEVLIDILKTIKRYFIKEEKNG